MLCSNSASNLSFHQPIKARRPFRQAGRNLTEFTLEKDQVYIAVIYSDGDSINFVLRGGHGGNWARRRPIPMGWELQPLMLELCPGLLEYY